LNGSATKPRAIGAGLSFSGANLDNPAAFDR
jgi:hypothetical protein